MTHVSTDDRALETQISSADPAEGIFFGKCAKVNSFNLTHELKCFANGEAGAI